MYRDGYRERFGLIWEREMKGGRVFWLTFEMAATASTPPRKWVHETGVE